jgi:hypothetical protein
VVSYAVLIALALTVMVAAAVIVSSQISGL